MSLANHSGVQLPKPVQRWKKPPRDSIKINVDAAFNDGGSSIQLLLEIGKGKWYLLVIREYIPTFLFRQSKSH